MKEHQKEQQPAKDDPKESANKSQAVVGGPTLDPAAPPEDQVEDK